MFNFDFVVGLNTPLGPAAYHFKFEFWDLFDEKELPKAPNYDEYTPMETLERFQSIVEK